eukprot:2527949-Pleurochrysis_carterae.AAC.1
MDDADDDDNVAAAPGVDAGMATNSDCNNTAPAAGMDDTICFPCPPLWRAATSVAGSYHLCLYFPAWCTAHQYCAGLCQIH